MKIKAIFQTLGYDEGNSEVVTETYREEISMEVVDYPRHDGTIKKSLKFIGGPTGYESYLIETLLDNSYGRGLMGRGLMDREPLENFCICGGTVGLYQRCTVNVGSVQEFLRSEGLA